MDFTSVQGEVVEIFEREGRRFARILLAPHVVCDVTAENCAEAHLGDRVLVAGRVIIHEVRVVASADEV